ncbi:O-antigen ligase family protein [Microbacterium aurugineum]|uniref:O-antigen ligase family protein n=1 Tax=Microbacterium TaxID=33882 RepID=UPI001E522F57|nr:O-antigen ligase family protein [Microbacterium sp. KKR3/1]MCE0509070.1 O-antigen ligase family protein [Microbacterium sp. KKR3/1]
MNTHATVVGRTPSRTLGASRSTLPRWPFTAMLAFFPLWWVLGFAEMAWIPLAGCMAVLMIRRGGIQVPRGFSIWLLFIVLMCASVIGIDTSGRLIGFIYRALLYIAITVVFIYVYNARETLTLRYMLGVFTLFWLWAVLGGFAGIIAPEFSFRTPLSYVLPQGLQANELIGEMVVRRLTQYNPDSWLALDPRPSAPFLYTNGWGNVYSITLPMVVAYLTVIPRGRRFWLLILAIPLSLIPAFLTLNRGMFIGLAVAAAYLFVRFVLAGRLRAVALLSVIGIIAGIAAVALDVGSKLTDRVETSSSTEDRANLYEETFVRTLHSPLFGYGAPRPSFTDGAPSAGTQGHLWMVMFSHGFPALVCFMAALAWMFFATIRGRSTAMLILNTVQLVILVEVFFYGVLPNGLILTFPAAALAIRELRSTALAPPPTTR